MAAVCHDDAGYLALMFLLLLGCSASLDDADGDRWTVVAGDCDDEDPAVFPDADEYCNGYDDDCDGTIDGADAVDQGWVDLDGDGLGSFFGCDDQSRYVSEGGDCDDEDAAVGGPIQQYDDADGDGYGGLDHGLVCPDASLVQVGGDCDDADSALSPDENETCNGFDDDCDGAVDEGLDVLDHWPDLDGDGRGDVDRDPVSVCAGLPDLVDNNDDCVDDQVDVFEGLWYQTTEWVELSGYEGSYKTFTPSEHGTLHVCPSQDPRTIGIVVNGLQVSVLGHGHRDDVVLSGADTGMVVQSYDATVSIQGVTIQDGVDIGIYVEDTTFNGTDFVVGGNGQGSVGHGMEVRGDSEVTLVDCVFQSNFGHFGGGLWFATGAEGLESTIERCTFVDNEGLNGAGAGGDSTAYRGAVILRDSTFEGNSSTGNGAGWSHEGTGSLTLDTVRFLENEAYDGAGLYAKEAGAVSLVDTTFSNNGATGGGAGAWFHDTSLSMAGTGFDENAALGTGAGGLRWVQTNTNTTLDLGDTGFVGNSAKGGGGALALTTEVAISCSSASFLENRSTSGNGGAMQWYGPSFTSSVRSAMPSRCG